MIRTPRRAGRILMLSLHGYVAAKPELGRPDTGGQVLFVLELARRFGRLGHRVDVVTRGSEDQPEEDRVAEGVRVWRIPFGGPAFIRKEDMHDHLDAFVAAFLAAARADRIGYDVVNSHYWDAGWAGQRIADELRIPHVHTPHSLGAWKRDEMGGVPDEQAAGYRFEERIRKEFLVYRTCDHVVATSAQQIEMLRAGYQLPAEQVSLVPPGIDETRFAPAPPESLRAARARLGFRPHDVYAVGRAATNKGYDLLLRCLPELRKLVPDARLQIAAGADTAQDRRLLSRWKALAEELGVARFVRWLSYVPDPDMADHYRAAGVFALPSRYEPFGMTAAEAIACGTPAVVTVHGGLHEMLEFGAHALFADPKHPTEFAAMLAMPLRYPRLRERLSLHGARFVRRNLGWTGIARKTLAIFDRVRGSGAERLAPPPLAADAFGETAAP